MRTATTIEASAGRDAVEFAVEAERLGLDVCWVAEAWGADAPSPLGYLAARTERMLLGSGVIQIGTRSPVTIAQTAMTLAHLSGGRFLLGLGVSGPQVMEGLHGVPFGHPLGRMRETVEIVRRVFTGEKVTYAGRHYGLPLAGSKPMRVSLPPVSVPVYLATLSPKMLALTGEIADGWLGTSFIPEQAGAYLTYLDEGLARAGRTQADLDICQGAEICLVDEADLARTLAARKSELAFSLGGMGTATANFYNDAYSRQGWAEVAAEVRDALAGGRPGRRGRPGHRRDGAGHHADRYRGHGARPAPGLARGRRGHRPPLPVRRHPGRPPRHPGPRHRPGPGGLIGPTSGRAGSCTPGIPGSSRPGTRRILHLLS